MPARLLPDKTTLRRLVDEGMTHNEIVEWIADNLDVSVARSTVASALSRAGLTEPGQRYTEQIPWRVQQDHLKHYAARMLRLLGRRQANLPLTEDQEKRLDDWMNKMRKDHSVVVYLPDSPDGFYYVDGDWDAPDLPIMRDISTAL